MCTFPSIYSCSCVCYCSWIDTEWGFRRESFGCSIQSSRSCSYTLCSCGPHKTKHPPSTAGSAGAHIRKGSRQQGCSERNAAPKNTCFEYQTQDRLLEVLFHMCKEYGWMEKSTKPSLVAVVKHFSRGRVSHLELGLKQLWKHCVFSHIWEKLWFV